MGRDQREKKKNRSIECGKGLEMLTRYEETGRERKS